MEEYIKKIVDRPRIVVIRKKASEIWWVLPVVCSLISIIAGTYFFFHIPNKINEENHDTLLSRIETIGVLTDTANVAMLSGTVGDLNTDVYSRVKQTLYNIHDVTIGARIVYYMRLNTEGNFVYLADSERPGSQNYSPPGKIYDKKISPDEKNNFLNAVSFTKGPYDDELGTWVSGYSPIWYQGKLVGIVGMDTDASKWAAQLDEYRKNILEITLLVALVFGLFGIHIRRLIFSYSTRV